ncbi:MAG TPA: DNA-3-methyladenine glycosylase [Polyangiaceae bacterium]|nr:DNA-3-methyladenine glycosylase [Polyangiaceae bacterium]
MSVPVRAALPRAFYSRPVLEVARDCIGKVVVHACRNGVAAGRVVEAEAYRGPDDLAAHSAGGRRTSRTEVMFGPPGYAYVFLIYGMHFHLNLVTGSVGEPHAVLIRAIEPTVGAELMAARRGMAATRRELTNGPGKLCEALAITKQEYGADLCGGSALYLVDGPPPRRVARATRVGVDYAGVWAAKPWRFFDADSEYVSDARRTRARHGR